MKNSTKATIQEVASHSGVSIGTVDRVLHNRNGVSKKSKSKVLEAIETLGYETNIYASLLSSKNKYSIIFIIPEYSEGEFWEITKQGINRSIQLAKSYPIDIQILEYNQYDVISFKETCNKVLSLKPSGVIFPPLFKEESKSFVKTLSAKEIPYIYIDTKIEDDGYYAYFGIPMYQSGYLCAHLISNNENISDVAIVRIIRDKNKLADPTFNRRNGFLDYMSTYQSNCEIHNLFIEHSDSVSILNTLSDYFSKHPEIRHIVNFNSRIHLIGEFLENQHNNNSLKYNVVGFDNLEQNIALLENGLANFIIAQHPDEQAISAVKALTDKFLLRKDPPKRDNYMHMDILTKYNI